jgi:uncharacterized cupin superfamily protein
MIDSDPNNPCLCHAFAIQTLLQLDARTFSFPWNPNSRLAVVGLGDAVGLKRTGVSIARVLPGKESYIYHLHHRSEEWIYVLSGRGIAEIDDKEYEVGPGDFMGFPTPSVAHHMRNPFETDLVYLQGGERLDLEVADMPRLGKRMVHRATDGIDVYNLVDGEPYLPKR